MSVARNALAVLDILPKLHQSLAAAARVWHSRGGSWGLAREAKEWAP